MSALKRRHVLDLDDFAPAEIERVLDTAVEMREVLRRPIKRVPALRGKTIVNMFYEASTRTRVSFELAGKNLSADVVNVSASGSSVEKGESIVDTMQTLEALGADTIVIRHSQSGAPYLAAAHTSASIINAGDGWHAHPTQALLDLYTIRERFGRVEGLTVVIIGDVLHSRVARSNIWGLTRMGARVVLSAPHSLLPDLRVDCPSEADCRCRVNLPSVAVEPELDRAIEGADVVMALRMQRERQTGGLLPSLREYIRRYQVDRARLARARPEALVMHPGPMNEGVEIAPDVAHGSQSVIAEQVTNGVAVRMALLYLLQGEAVDAL
ncbi:MAG TPA: aspartate carbamoyltransferase catalytic subunit [Chloroflexota bacterium]